MDIRFSDGVVLTAHGPRAQYRVPHEDQINLLSLSGKPMASIYGRSYGTQVSLHVGSNLFNPLTRLAQKKGRSFKRPGDSATDTIKFLLTQMQKAHA